MPFSCAASRASAICRAIVSASPIETGTFCDSASASVGAFHQFEHQGRDARVLEAVDRGDVRMIQRGQHARFALEPTRRSGSEANAAGQDLDRDVACEPRVARAIDFAHAAGAEKGVDAIDANLRQRGPRPDFPSSILTCPLRWCSRVAIPL